jgi:hypothetical protein
VTNFSKEYKINIRYNWWTVSRKTYIRITEEFLKNSSFFRTMFLSNLEKEFQPYQLGTDSTSAEAFGDIRK